jgi:hypothetical protein
MVQAVAPFRGQSRGWADLASVRLSVCPPRRRRLLPGDEAVVEEVTFHLLELDRESDLAEHLPRRLLAPDRPEAAAPPCDSETIRRWITEAV